MDGSSRSLPFGVDQAQEGQRGHENLRGGAAGLGTMQKLLEGIHSSRMSIENDRKAYEKARSDIDSLNEKISCVSQQCATNSKRLREIEELHALRSTELSHFSIKLDVANEGLLKVEEEVRKGWDELSLTRKKALELTSTYLRESTEFGNMWNCTELGRKNREALRLKELEEMRRIKHRLEYDLEEFLVKLNRVNEAKQELKDLESEFRAQEANVQSRENEAYKRLQEKDDALNQLWKKQEAMTRECDNEVNRLQQKIQQSRGSISYWERRVSENQRTVEHQRSQVAKERSPILAGNQFMNHQQNQNQTGNLNASTGPSNNKSARIYQPVKPTLKAIQPTSTTVGKKPVFQNPPIVNINKVKAQTQHQFQNPPFVTSHKTNPQEQSKYSFGDIDDFSMNVDMESSNQNSSCGNSNSNYVSLPSSSCFPNKSATSTSSGPSKVFQFKKKSIDGLVKSPNNIISGPTQRSVTVSLGNTPFSTFQNSRSVLQFQHGRSSNQNNSSNDNR